MSIQFKIYHVNHKPAKKIFYGMTQLENFIDSGFSIFSFLNDENVIMAAWNYTYTVTNVRVQ